jgi:hypothetical protein
VVKPVSGGFIGSDAVGGGCDGCGGGGGGDDGGAAVDVAEAPCSPGTTRCGDAGRERCDEGAK